MSHKGKQLVRRIRRTDALQDEALVEAVKGGEAAEVERLLKEGADPEAKGKDTYEDGRPALILAAMLAYALRQAVLRSVSDVGPEREATIAGLERSDEGGV